MMDQVAQRHYRVSILGHTQHAAGHGFWATCSEWLCLSGWEQTRWSPGVLANLKISVILWRQASETLWNLVVYRKYFYQYQGFQKLSETPKQANIHIRLFLCLVILLWWYSLEYLHFPPFFLLLTFSNKKLDKEEMLTVAVEVRVDRVV